MVTNLSGCPPDTQYILVGVEVNTVLKENCFASMHLGGTCITYNLPSFCFHFLFLFVFFFLPPPPLPSPFFLSSSPSSPSWECPLVSVDSWQQAWSSSAVFLATFWNWFTIVSFLGWGSGMVQGYPAGLMPKEGLEPFQLLAWHFNHYTKLALMSLLVIWLLCR